MNADVQTGFKQSVLKSPKRKVKPPIADPKDRFIKTLKPKQNVSEEAQHVLSNSKNIVDILKRYEMQWGDASTPQQSQADIELPTDATNIWNLLFGEHDEKPTNIHQMVGDIKEALGGALTEKHMIESGEKINNTPPQLESNPMPLLMPS